MLNDGETFELPPNLSSTKIAPPGEYRLVSPLDFKMPPKMTLRIITTKESSYQTHNVSIEPPLI